MRTTTEGVDDDGIVHDDSKSIFVTVPFLHGLFVTVLGVCMALGSGSYQHIHRTSLVLRDLESTVSNLQRQYAQLYETVEQARIAHNQTVAHCQDTTHQLQSLRHAHAVLKKELEESVLRILSKSHEEGIVTTTATATTTSPTPAKSYTYTYTYTSPSPYLYDTDAPALPSVSCPLLRGLARRVVECMDMDMNRDVWRSWMVAGLESFQPTRSSRDSLFQRDGDGDGHWRSVNTSTTSTGITDITPLMGDQSPTEVCGLFLLCLVLLGYTLWSQGGETTMDTTTDTFPFLQEDNDDDDDDSISPTTTTKTNKKNHMTSSHTTATTTSTTVGMSLWRNVWTPHGGCIDALQCWSLPTRNATDDTTGTHTGTHIGTHTHTHTHVPCVATLSRNDKELHFWDLAQLSSRRPSRKAVLSGGRPLDLGSTAYSFVHFSDVDEGTSWLATRHSEEIKLWLWQATTSGQGPHYRHVASLNQGGGGCLFALVAYQLDGRPFLASGGCHHTIQLWDVRERRCVNTLRGHTDGIWALAMVSPRDHGHGHGPNPCLASGSGDGTVRLWNLRTHQLVATLTGHTGRVTSLHVIPTRTHAHTHTHTHKANDDDEAPRPVLLLASGSYDGTVRLWKVTDTDTDKDMDGTCIGILAGHTQPVMALAAMGERCLVSGGWDGTIVLWDVDQRRPLQTLEGHSSVEKGIRSLATVMGTVHGEKYLLSGDQAGNLKLWK